MTTAQRRRIAVLVMVLAMLAPALQLGLLAARPVAAADLLLVINQVLTDEFPEVAVYFTFTDGTGVPITDVSKDRVQVVHNGKPVPELSLDLAESEQDGLSVVVAIDTSGSMQGQPLEYARTAVRQALEQMGPRDQGAIVSFGQTVQVVQDLTGDREALNRALDSLQAKGDTALYDGTFEAISLVAKQPLGRRAVIVISDGEDTHSTLKLDDVIAKARETSTPVSAIAIGDFQLDPLRRLTLTTGGTLGEAPSPERLAERATQLSELLRKQYVLRYRAPDTRPPENEVEIAVSQAGQQMRAAQRFPAPPMPLAISLPGLQPGATVSGQVELQPTLTNAERVDSVEYLLDGAPLGAVTEPPYRFTWNSAGVQPGLHTLTVRARLGEQVSEQSVPLVVAATTVVPAASPSPGAGVAPPAGASPGAAGKPAGAGQAVTPTVGATRTPTATPTEESTVREFIEENQTLLLIGLAAAAALVGVILFAASRQSRRIAEQRAGTPDTTPLPPGILPGPGVPPGPGAPYEPPTREAHTIDYSAVERPTREAQTIDHAAVESPTMEFPLGRDLRESQTEMISALPHIPAQPPGPPPSASVTVRVTGTPDRAWALGPDQIIGRSAGPGVVVVPDPQVSRRHARLSWEDGHFVYRDFAPMNPTRRDGRTLPNPYIVQSGDRLAVGKAEIVITF